MGGKAYPVTLPVIEMLKVQKSIRKNILTIRFLEIQHFGICLPGSVHDDTLGLECSVVFLLHPPKGQDFRCKSLCLATIYDFSDWIHLFFFFIF